MGKWAIIYNYHNLQKSSFVMFCDFTLAHLIHLPHHMGIECINIYFSQLLNCYTPIVSLVASLLVYLPQHKGIKYVIIYNYSSLLSMHVFKSFIETFFVAIQFDFRSVFIHLILKKFKVAVDLSYLMLFCSQQIAVLMDS